jgi:hypothetical protein
VRADSAPGLSLGHQNGQRNEATQCVNESTIWSGESGEPSRRLVSQRGIRATVIMHRAKSLKRPVETPNDGKEVVCPGSAMNTEATPFAQRGCRRIKSISPATHPPKKQECLSDLDVFREQF